MTDARDLHMRSVPLMQIKFNLPCQRVRNVTTGIITVFFERDERIPAFLMQLPKEYEPCVEGANYLITIEPATNGSTPSPLSEKI